MDDVHITFTVYIQPQELASETGRSQSTASDGSFVVIPPPSTRPADDTPHVLTSSGDDEVDAGATCVGQ